MRTTYTVHTEVTAQVVTFWMLGRKMLKTKEPNPKE